MRIRLASTIAAAMLLVPVAAASAKVPSSAQPKKNCPSLNLILNHCD